MRTYYLIIVFVIAIISFGAVAGVLYLLQRLGVIHALSISTLIALLIVSAVAGCLASYLIGRRILTPMVKLSKASHEFKTPLTAIEGYAMLLQDPALPAAEREEYLNKILFNTHRLSTLVGSILLLSKIESKSLSEQSTTFRLDEQIRQAVVSLETQWTQKNIGFDAVLDPVSVTGCENLLGQVWTNLLSNAIKFSEPGQEISVRLLEQTECVVVSITDHGCGMTPEVQKRVFEKFYQGDSAHATEGNGLGLSLARRIVDLCGGTIEVHSRVGEGTAFIVKLPDEK